MLSLISFSCVTSFSLLFPLGGAPFLWLYWTSIFRFQKYSRFGGPTQHSLTRLVLTAPGGTPAAVADCGGRKCVVGGGGGNAVDMSASLLFRVVGEYLVTSYACGGGSWSCALREIGGKWCRL